MRQARKSRESTFDLENSSTSTASLTPPLANSGGLSSSPLETPVLAAAAAGKKHHHVSALPSPSSLSSWRHKRSDLRVDTSIGACSDDLSTPMSSNPSPDPPLTALFQRRPSPTSKSHDGSIGCDESPRRLLDYHTTSPSSSSNGSSSSPYYMMKVSSRRRKRRSKLACAFVIVLFFIFCSLWSTFFVLIQQHVSDKREDLTMAPVLFGRPSDAKGRKDHVRRDKPEQPRPETSSMNGVANIQDAKPSLMKPEVVSKTERIPPRVVHLAATGGDIPAEYNPLRDLVDDPMLHAPPGFEAAVQDRMKTDETIGNCEPMHEWQTESFPNCNTMHEIDMLSAGAHVGKTHEVSYEDDLLLLGAGWFRQAWRLDKHTTDDSVVIKTLRLDREFYDEYYDLHRRDAVAMERLSHSTFVMDIYGYCGQSAINELANFGYGGITSLEKFDRNMRGNDSPEANLLKLQVASSVAVGLAHVHEIDLPDTRPSMVHYDMNPRNIAITKGGRPKLNDFNTAEFLRWDPTTNKTCGFPSRLHEPWWRAPEEVDKNNTTVRYVDEKVDVYALGNILFHILTTHSPRGKMKKERMEEVRADVLAGVKPEMPEFYAKHHDPAIKAIREAMDLCFVFEPDQRGSSRQVANVLLDSLIVLKKKRGHKKQHAKRHL